MFSLHSGQFSEINFFNQDAGDRVIATGSPWLASCNPVDCKKAAPDQAMPLQGFN